MMTASVETVLTLTPMQVFPRGESIEHTRSHCHGTSPDVRRSGKDAGGIARLRAGRPEPLE